LTIFAPPDQPPTHPQEPPHAEPHAEGHQGSHADHDSPEAIKKETVRYIIVFFALAVLTGVTVGVSKMHLAVHEAIILALSIASVKAFLVAAYFMHLLSERKLIYSVLLLTVIFFGMLIWGPWQHHYDVLGHS